MPTKKGDHGLVKQISYVEDNIAIKKRLGKDASFEEGLIKEWQKYLPGGDKRHLWLAYTHDQPWPEDRRDIAVVKS